MKKALLFTLTLMFTALAHAEFDFFDDVDLDPFDMQGFTPRYAYVVDDGLIGDTHYFGLSYYTRHGDAYEGPTLRVGAGTRGEKVNLAYTDGFSFMNVDFGLSYYFLDTDNPLKKELEAEENLALELGLRFWVIQFVGIVMESTSEISLAYGF